MSELEKYPFDPTGKAITNRIENEEHEVGGHQNMVFVPNHAPFFGQGLIVSTEDGRVLIPGKEYKPIYLHQEASMEVGLPIFTSIVILNELIIGKVRCSYQNVGGDKWGGLAPTIVEIVENLEQIDPTVYWDDIAFKPDEFNPVDHKHLAVDMIGMSEVVTSINEVRDAILEGQQGGDLSTKVSKLGHRKLVVDEGLLKLADHTGPVVLTFGRSHSQNSRLSLDFRVMMTGGTAMYNITGDEIDGGIENITYSSIAPKSYPIPMALFTDGSGANMLVLGSEDTVWSNTVISIDSLTVSAFDTSPFLRTWLWETDVSGIALPETSIPTREIDDLNVNLAEIEVAVVALSDLLAAHINDRNDPHGVTADDGQLGNVENFGVSTDFQEESPELYATAKSVHELGHATSDYIADVAEELNDAIKEALDRGRTF